MIFIRELKHNPAKYFLPDKFAYLFDEYCENCESPMQITEDLKHYQCSNTKCPTNIAAMLYSILQNTGAEHITYEEAEGMVKHNKWENPYQFFIHNTRKRFYDQITKSKQRYYAKFSTTCGVFTLAEYVGYVGLIPLERCEDYFAECKTLKECGSVLHERLNKTATTNKIDLNLLQDLYRFNEINNLLEEGLKFIDIEV